MGSHFQDEDVGRSLGGAPFHSSAQEPDCASRQEAGSKKANNIWEDGCKRRADDPQARGVHHVSSIWSIYTTLTKTI